MSLRLPSRFALLCLSLFAALAVPLGASAAPRVSGARPALQAMPGASSPVSLLRGAQFLGAAPASQTVTATLCLPWRNAAELSQLTRRQASPGDPLYKKWVTAQEFDARFSPTQASYSAVKQWAAGSGLRVSQEFKSRALVSVSGSAADVQRAFGVSLLRYKLPGGRVALRVNRTPRLPVSVASQVFAVTGLDTVARRVPFMMRRTPRPQVFAPNGKHPAEVGTGLGGGLTPADIKSVYALNGAGVGDGTGQTIALYELDGYVQSDIDAYAAAYGLGTVNVQAVHLNGFDGVPTSGVDSAQGEVTLDIEMALALAPRAAIVVYEADNSSAGSLAIYDSIATQNTASVVSVSYGLAEAFISTSERASENSLFQRMVAQGQCVYVSAGDNGAYEATSFNATTGAGTYTQAVNDPASQPNVVSVGGTSLLGTTAATATVATYQGETTWNNFPDTTVPTDTTVKQYGAGGGGTSIYWAKPSYQAGVGASLANGGTGMRDLPDVSLNSDPQTGYSVYLTDYSAITTAAPVPPVGFGIFGGTSAAAPLWAAFNALVNQRRALFSLGRLGFANPDIYTIGAGNTYAANFHDIKDGSTNLIFAAKTGFDDATGWGSFIGSGLLASLAPTASAPETLQGTVVDQNGQAVANAVVTITTPLIPTFSVSQTTDGTDGGAAGSFSQNVNSLLQSSPTSAPTALTYTVSVDAPGFSGQTVTNVSVPATLSLTLRAPDHVYDNPGTLQMISSPYDYTAQGDFLALFNLTADQLIKSTNNPTPPALIIWAPDLQRYLLYPSAPADTLRIGRGYWARLGTDGTVRRSGAPAPAGAAFRINLTAGWNQIGDPFTRAVPIGSVQVEGTASAGTAVGITSSTNIVLPLYAYSGGAYQAVAATDALQPFVGYWIYSNSAVTLVVPPPGQ